MTISIDSVTKPSDAQWAEVWADCDYATYFHSPEWAKLWSVYSAGRIRPAPKLVTFSDGVRALIPLSYESRLGGLLSRYVSSSEGTFGGWMSRDALTLDHAVLLLDWLTKRQGKNLVWRMNPYDELSFRAGRVRDIDCRADETHALDLRVGLDALFKRFKSRYRSDIRKALDKGGFTVAPATTLEDWHSYYRIYQDSLERWGQGKSEGYSWPLFEALFELRSPHVKLWLARVAGEVVSGNVCFYAKQHVVYWHGSTLKDHLSSNVAKLVMYEAIKDAANAGRSWFDFNPSAGLTGVKFFKEGFNAQPMPAPIVYVDTALKQLARSCAARFKVKYAKLELEPLALVSPVAVPFQSGPVAALKPAAAAGAAAARVTVAR
jgi:GNAT acetyltransferase-like protein